LQTKGIGRKAVHFLYRWYKTAFALIFLVLLGLGVWQWYYHTAKYSWTEEQKRTFWDEYANEVDFRGARFDGAIQELDRRAREHEAGRDIERDVFRLQEPKVPEPITPENEPEREVPTGPPLQD
jgi:hypothetical protein